MLWSEPDSDDEHCSKGMGFVAYSYYLQLADTLKYISKNIFICIMEEQCSDEG